MAGNTCSGTSFRKHARADYRERPQIAVAGDPQRGAALFVPSGFFGKNHKPPDAGPWARFIGDGQQKPASKQQWWITLFPGWTGDRDSSWMAINFVGERASGTLLEISDAAEDSLPEAIPSWDFQELVQSRVEFLEDDGRPRTSMRGWDDIQL